MHTDIRGGDGRPVAHKIIGAHLSEQKAAPVFRDVVFQQPGRRVGRKRGQPVRVAGRAGFVFVDQECPGKIYLVLPDVEAGKPVRSTVRIDAGREVAVIALFAVFLQDDVQMPPVEEASYRLKGWSSPPRSCIASAGILVEGKRGGFAVPRCRWSAHCP